MFPSRSREWPSTRSRTTLPGRVIRARNTPQERANLSRLNHPEFFSYECPTRRRSRMGKRTIMLARGGAPMDDRGKAAAKSAKMRNKVAA